MMHHMKEKLFGPVEVPILTSVGRTEIDDFLDRYETYLLMVASRNALGDEIQPMEMKFCVDNQLLKTLVKHQIGVGSVEELTQEQLKEYLDGCLKVSNFYVPDLDTIFSELTLGEAMDANARVIDLFTQTEEIIRRNGLTEVSEKTIIPFILKAIEPASLRRRIENERKVRGKERFQTREQLFPLIEKHMHFSILLAVGALDVLF